MTNVKLWKYCFTSVASKGGHEYVENAGMPSPLLLLLCTTSCCCSLAIRNIQILLPIDKFLLLHMLWVSSIKYQLATQIGSKICKQCGIDFMYFIASQLLHMSVSAYTSSTTQSHCIIHCWNQYDTLFDIFDCGIRRYQEQQFPHYPSYALYRRRITTDRN